MKKNIITSLLITVGLLTSISIGAKEVKKNEVTPSQSLIKPTSSSVDKRFIKIRLTHVTKANTPKGLAAIKFKELLESKFQGRVSVSVSEDNKLFNDIQEIEALELGATDIIIPTTGKIAAGFKLQDYQIFDLPFLFEKTEDVNKFINSQIGTNFLKEIEDNTSIAKALAFWPLDFREYSGPIAFKSPKDFKPYSFRVESSGLLKKTFQAYGVKDAVQLSFGELPAALRKEGEVKLDGAELPISNFAASNLQESQKWITVSDHNFQSYVFVVNKKWFASLPEDIQQGITQLSRELASYHMALAQDSKVQLRKELESKGVKFHDLTKEEKSEFKKVAISVHEDFMKNINKTLLEETYGAINSK